MVSLTRGIPGDPLVLEHHRDTVITYKRLVGRVNESPQSGSVLGQWHRKTRVRIPLMYRSVWTVDYNLYTAFLNPELPQDQTIRQFFLSTSETQIFEPMIHECNLCEYPHFDIDADIASIKCLSTSRA